MSTDPREFEHPIDGSGTPTPEAIEAGVASGMDTHDWELLQTQGDIGEAVELAIRDALSVAAPLIAAQAKAEALREAMTDEALEVARALIENELIEWRDSCMFTMRRNGLSIRNKDGSGSEIIRFGFEMGYRMALANRLETIEGKSE